MSRARRVRHHHRTHSSFHPAMLHDRHNLALLCLSPLDQCHFPTTSLTVLGRAALRLVLRHTITSACAQWQCWSPVDEHAPYHAPSLHTGAYGRSQANPGALKRPLGYRTAFLLFPSSPPSPSHTPTTRNSRYLTSLAPCPAPSRARHPTTNS